jgi:hypothetical protein
MKIITHTSNTDKEWSSLCIASQKEYAEKIGVEHTVYENISTDGRSTEWARFRTMQGVLTQAQVGEGHVWMDSDLMVMNPDFDLPAMVREFESDNEVSVCVFPLGGNLDLSLVFFKNIRDARTLFDFGWDVGKSEAQGQRRDRLSIELMSLLSPSMIRAVSPEGILSRWYPKSPLFFYNQKIDTEEGKLGLLMMKKPKEMLEGFGDIYVPGTFSVHLKEKGANLLQISKEFDQYRRDFLDSVEESRAIIRDIKMNDQK